MNNEPVAWIKLDEVREHFESVGCGTVYKTGGEGRAPLYTHPVKDLTDEEINEVWAESHEDGIAMQQGFTTQQHYFAHLILRKAQEK